MSIIGDEIRKNHNSEKMDPLMHAIKTIHSTLGASNPENEESLNKQRASMERLSKLAAINTGMIYERNLVGDIPTEWAIPEFAHRKDKVILYCHGGGYTCGGLGYARILAGKLAYYTGLETLAFEYRLAPENPYPSAIEDAIAIWNHLLFLGYGAKNIIIAGDSAGGNLALEICLILKITERFLPGGLILMSPWTDMTATSSSYEKYKDLDPLLTLEYILDVRKAYAGSYADTRDPSFSPLFGDLSELPPTLIQVGSNEILRSDSEQLYKNMRKQNVPCSLEVYKGGWHVFQQMPISKATKAMEDVKIFMDKYIL